MMTLGTDLKTREPVTLAADHARVLLICGKRGSGKSYTLGVLAEELFQQHPRPCVLIVDPVGIFWTMSQSADPEKPGLPAPRARQAGLPLQFLVPGEPTSMYPKSLRAHFTRCGIAMARLTLDPAELSSDAWCELFALSVNEPLGIALTRAVQSLTGSTTSFDLDAVEEALQRDPLSQDRTKEALLNRLSIAKSWGLFAATSADVTTTVTPERVNVLDLAVLDYGPQGLRSLVLAIVARRLFTHHQRLRQQALASVPTPLPKLWLLIDEAHQFIPQSSSTLAKDTLIRWVKEGRQPGLSCALASQQPGSLDQDVLSQCDALISHKLTNLEDLQAANRLSQAYMGSELKVYLRHLKQPGQAVLVDDARERVAMLQVRPRRTRHGGGEL